MGTATMASPALMFSYLFLVLIVVVIIVLLCLGCSCHIPLGKCVRCFCENTTECCARCCPRRKKKDDKFKSVLDEPRRGPDAPKSARAANDETSQAGCLHWVPFVLTCGYCCGAFKDEEEEADGDEESDKGKKRASASVQVAQPVDEVVGTDYAVAASMPLLSMASS